MKKLRQGETIEFAKTHITGGQKKIEALLSGPESLSVPTPPSCF